MKTTLEKIKKFIGDIRHGEVSKNSEDENEKQQGKSVRVSRGIFDWCSPEEFKRDLLIYFRYKEFEKFKEQLLNLPENDPRWKIFEKLMEVLPNLPENDPRWKDVEELLQKLTRK
jgi:hypothetical protein